MLRTLTLALLAAAPTAQEQKTKPGSPPGELHTVATGSVSPEISLDAVFEAARSAEIRLRPKVYRGEFMILKAVSPGALVKKDEPLLKLDPEPFEEQLADAERELRVARSALKKKRATLVLEEQSEANELEKTECSLKDAETGLKVFKEVEGKHLLERAELSVKYGRNAVENQQEELDQLLKMYKSEELTNETSEIVVKRARRSLERAKTQLAMTIETARVTREVHYPRRLRSAEDAVRNARFALRRLRISQEHVRIERKASLERAEKDFEKKEQEVADLVKDRAGLTLHAPFPGRVFFGPLQKGRWASAQQLERQLQPDKKVQAETVLMTVCGPALCLAADLPEKNFFDVDAGAEVTVEPVSLEGVSLKGTVASKSILPDAGGGFPIRIDLKKSPLKLLPGMKAKVNIRGPELSDVVVVPVKGVSKSTVKIWKEGKAEPRPVETGKSDGSRIEIKRGLEPGEVILLPKE